MAGRIFYWIDHTGLYDGNSGIQRVVRALAGELAAQGRDIVPVRWCAEREAIVRAERNWIDGLARYEGPALPPNAEEGQPIHLTDADKGHLSGSWFLLPEVPHVQPMRAPALPVVLDYARYYGLKLAVVFYDLVPLRFPGYDEMKPAHALYARCMAASDLVMPISQYAADTLQQWWSGQNFEAAHLPASRPVLLPHEMPGVPRTLVADTPTNGPVRFLALGTVEPRKNQVELMRAFSRLCRRRPDLDLRLDVFGSIHPAVADAVAAESAVEQRIALHGYGDENTVREHMDRCHATVFVSLEEGYGLPIAESLWHGKPCLCSGFGSMQEIAEGGGCLLIDSHDGNAIERGLEQLADDKALRLRLAKEAVSRRLRTWSDYAADVAAALDSVLPARQIIVIEGSRGGGSARETRLPPGVRVQRLHWQPGTRSLLPGYRDAVRHPEVADGCLDREWALLPLASANGADEAIGIIAQAHALGLKVAIEADAVPLADDAAPVLRAADLALFPDDRSRDSALANALRTLRRTATLRERFLTGADARALDAIATQRPRLTEAPVGSVPTRVFYWAGLTVTQEFNTGIQRVTRQLAAGLERAGIEVIPVKWDEAAGRLTAISEGEAEHLARWRGPAARPQTELPERLAGEWLLVPELTIPIAPKGSNPARVAHQLGMKAAVVFYDLTPLSSGDAISKSLQNAFIHYIETLSDYDLILPISWTMSADLANCLAERRLRQPLTVPCPLAGEIPGVSRERNPKARARDAATPLKFLAVGSIEPRKNYPRLIRALVAARKLTSRPLDLTIAGRRGFYPQLDAEVDGLVAQVSGVRIRDDVSDEQLLQAFADSDATVYASWEEGFGLPVLESLWSGVPCVCHAGSALAEVAPGGGTIMVDMRDESAIAAALARLADEPGLLGALALEATKRPIREWDGYARDVLAALARTKAAVGWPLPAIVARRPLLSCCITTYNRAPWLAFSLSRLFELTRPWRDVVEVVVCDNASTDNTPEVVAQFAGGPNFVNRRNPGNVGMLGNLGVTARVSRGAYVWLLGDDDLLVDGAIENVLEGLASHPDVEMAYMNYSYTWFDQPANLPDPNEIMQRATLVAPGGPNRRVDKLRDVAGLNENLFTAIYACAFRRDHALRAYQQDTRGKPFSSLATCVPSSTYTLNTLHERPAWWIGEPAIVVNMNVSWLRWYLLWHLERMPDLYDLAERAGVDPYQLDQYRRIHCAKAGDWAREALFESEDDIRFQFSMARLLERCKHLDAFRFQQVPALKQVYADAWNAKRVVADDLPPSQMFQHYGF